MAKGAGKIGKGHEVASTDLPALEAIPVEKEKHLSGIVSVVLTAPAAKLGWLRDAVITELSNQHTVDISTAEKDIADYIKGCFNGSKLDPICVTGARDIIAADYIFVIGGKKVRNDVFDVSLIILNSESATTLISLPVRDSKKNLIEIAKRIVVDKFGMKQEVAEPPAIAEAPPPKTVDTYVPPKAIPVVPMPKPALPEEIATSQITVEAPPPPDTFWRKWQMPVIFAGTAVVAGAAGGVLGFMANGKEKASHEATLRSDAFDIYGDAKNMSYAANGALALSVVLTGICTYFLIDSATTEEGN